MDNLVECNVCGKVMIMEEVDSHACTPRVKGYKTIEIAWYYIDKDQFGREAIYATDTDGIKYELVVKERKLIPLSKERLQPYISNNTVADPTETPDLEHPKKSPEDGDRTETIERIKRIPHLQLQAEVCNSSFL